MAHPTFEVSPATDRMTLFAACAELAVVGVVTAVACNAIATHGRRILSNGSSLRVTTLAAHLTVRTLQAVLGLGVVVETPDGPSSGVVAGVAAHTKFL